MALIAIGAAQICTDIHAERVVGVMLQCHRDRHGDQATFFPSHNQHILRCLTVSDLSVVWM